jgi:hypothetical protein
MATPLNIQHLGTTGLSALDNLTKYDILILADWDVPINEVEAEKLLKYFEEGGAMVATSQSIHQLYNVSSEIVKDVFGIEKAHPPDTLYSNLTYYTEHYVTSNFFIPFNSTGAEYGVPVSNLTTAAQGIATVASSEDLYLLVVNQRNDTRAAHFGLGVSEMNENDITIFKRLLLWTLHLET